MHDLSLADRTFAALTAADPASQEVDVPLRARRREALARIALVSADVAAVALSLAVVAAFSGARFTWWLAVLGPCYVLLTKMAGLYDRDQFVLHKTTLDETPRLVAVSAILVLAIEAVQGLQFTGRSHPLLLWGTLVGGLVLLRSFARFAVVRGTAPERLLVVGSAAVAVLVKRKLAADPSMAATVVGRVSVHPEAAKPPERLLGTVDELPAVLEEYGVDRVIVAPTQEGGEDVVDIIRLAAACGVRVAVLPRLLEVIGSSVVFDDLGGQVMLGMRGFGLSPSSRALKRIFDLVLATGLVIALAPLVLLIGLAVRLGSSGPVLFRQTRVGRNGNDFELLKFRTMVSDAEQRKHELLELNQAAPLFKIADDPRVTRVGRFLRRRSLDELPQLFNVLRGDMSLVGPRPLITEEDRLFSGWQRRRYHVAPGMTGPWQILGSSRVPMSDMVTIDYLYCANWSLWLDAKILARTIPYVLSRRSPEHRSPAKGGRTPAKRRLRA
jgi:exopolysaccharide biosynthesis polyprenyl glycosylphosphotransferase